MIFFTYGITLLLYHILFGTGGFTTIYSKLTNINYLFKDIQIAQITSF